MPEQLYKELVEVGVLRDHVERGHEPSVERGVWEKDSPLLGTYLGMSADGRTRVPSLARRRGASGRRVPSPMPS